MCTSTLPSSAPQNRESGKCISALVQIRSSGRRGGSTPATQKETGGGEREPPESEAAVRPWEDKGSGEMYFRRQPDTRPPGMREGEGGGKKALLQDGIAGAPATASEGRQRARAFCFPLFPPGGHCSTINRDKEGARRRVRTSQDRRPPTADPASAPGPGGANWP